jgi:transposase InsO family protein
MEVTGTATHSSPCEPCLKGKHARAEIQKATLTCADTVLAWVFSDLCGKFGTHSHHGFEYFTTFTDDKSRKVFVAGLRRKSNVLHHWQALVACVELETGHHVKALHTDGGGEYTGGKMLAFLESKGIQSEVTTPDTPQHNGVAEHMNWTLLDKVCMMLTNADLPKLYWFDTLKYAALFHNVMPT